VRNTSHSKDSWARSSGEGGRVEDRRGGVQEGPWLYPPFPASCPFRVHHHSVSDPRHIEPDRRDYRIRLTAKASSHRGYDSVRLESGFRGVQLLGYPREEFLSAHLLDALERLAVFPRGSAFAAGLQIGGFERLALEQMEAWAGVKSTRTCG
jgi:hypothetical protein